jgi:hypothetical protein
VAKVQPFDAGNGVQQAGKSQPGMARRGIGYASIDTMFLIIIGGALTLSSAVTLAFMAFRAPEAYETEQGLQVIRRIPKQRSTSRLTGAWAQAR